MQILRSMGRHNGLVQEAILKSARGVTYGRHMHSCVVLEFSYYMFVVARGSPAGQFWYHIFKKSVKQIRMSDVNNIPVCETYKSIIGMKQTCNKAH